MKYFYRAQPFRNNFIRALITVGILSAVTALGVLFNDADFIETAVVLAYFFAVIVIAWLTDSFIFSLAATALSTLLYNFVFTDPYYQFIVYDMNFITIFIIMSIAALISGSLTLLARRSALIARQKEEETEKERYNTNLLRSISHDIRTPLSAVIGAAEMLDGMTEPDDSRRELIKGIRDEADWLRSLVENILNLTRLQDDSVALSKQPEVLEEIVGGAIHRVSQRSPNHQITVNMPDELLFVPMDAKLIEQVLINLLDNAVRHTPPGKGISVTVEKEAEIVRITVLDEGEGIGAEHLENLFQSFYTTREKHSDASHGIGLGLAICKTIINAHGGDILARNRKDISGAEFTFTLPMEG